MDELQLTLEAQGLNVDLRLPAKGVTAVLGRSGAGKTTLLRSVAGLDRNARGKVLLRGETWQDDSKGIFLPTWRRSLGYVFQEPSLLAHLSVRKNIEFGLIRRLAGDGSVDFDETVQLLGLESLLERAPSTLSGGEKQRVAMARALASGPQLLLMDEPLAALDEQSKAEILPFLDRVRQQSDLPMLYVSHSIEEVVRLADHAVVLDAGRVTATGDIHELMARPDLPFNHGDHAASLLDVMVISHDSHYQLSQVKCGAGTLWLPASPAAIGTTLRLRIQARDVSLALSRPDDSSVLNCIGATVCTIRDDVPGQMLVELDAGGCRLFSRVTRKSVERLQLDIGVSLYAMIKTVAILK